MKKMSLLIAIFVLISTYAQDTMFIHTTNTSNIANNVTYLDHPDLNSNPSACLNYVHNWNPGGIGGVYNDNADGLWYNASNNRWAIYNEVPTVDMIEGASFTVYIADDGQCIDHVATVGNIDGSSTDIDDPLFNSNNPGPYAFMNTYYNPNNVYNPGNWATYFYTTGDVRSIFEQNNTDVPVGAAFKIAIPGSSTTRFTHTATDANTVSNSTIIDHPELNGNPDATFLFMHYFGIEPGTDVQLDARLGVWYNGSNWNIYREYLAPMLEGVAFDIAIGKNVTLTVDEQIVLNEVVIYPNPASEILTITAATMMDQIEIISIEGRSIQTVKVNTTSASLPLASLALGIYILKTTMGNQTQTTRFIKK